MDFAQARFNMIEQQVRPCEVLDRRVLQVMAANPREDYVPEAQRALAFADLELPLPHGQQMLAPKMEGRILQAVHPRAHDRVLEIGTGSGYLTACLASLAAHVTSVDIFPDFTTEAGYRLAAHDKENVSLRSGDAAQGWETHEHFDVVVVSGSLPVEHDGYARLLKEGGRLFLVTGTAPLMRAWLITRHGAGYSRQCLFETVLPPLMNAPAAGGFSF
jgi:protein-L-isoaspartate(D-aspartate) O-methyltransferase